MNTKTIINAATLLLVAVGIFFKLERWAGANVLLLSGFGLLLVSILAFTVSENAAAGMPAGLNYTAVAALAVGILATLFKLLHWDGGSLLVLLAVGLQAVVSVLLLTSRATIVGSRQLLTVTFLYITLTFAALFFLQKHQVSAPSAAPPVAAVHQAGR